MRGIRSVITTLLVANVVGANAAGHFKAARTDGAYEVSWDSQSVARYQLKPVENSKLPVDSACYFHPLMTPSGIVVTEVAPPDHPHHRGVFLAFVEMEGERRADFWGWGEYAPRTHRQIVNRSVTPMTTIPNGVGFIAENEWLADDHRMLSERLHAKFYRQTNANVIDLQFDLIPTADTELAQWAFGGFCARTRKDCTLAAFGPNGKIDLPNPNHLKPESDWPKSDWYDYTLKFGDGKTAGVAVISHPANPASLWHNHRDVRMLNPCITTPAKMQLKAHHTLTLRYRVVAHDGPVPTELLNSLAQKWK